MSVIELIFIQFLILFYLYDLIIRYKNPDNYEQLILVKGVFLIIACTVLNIWFYIENVSILFSIWEEIKDFFIKIFN